MSAGENYNVEIVWQNRSPELKAEVMGFWKRHRALPPGENPEERAEQVLAVARGRSHEILGVATANKIFSRRLNNYFYYYRTMSAPHAERQGIALELFFRAREHLETLSRTQKVEICKGILVEIQHLTANHPFFRLAVWPRTGLTFIGYNRKGFQTRVYYFEGAEI